MALARRAEVAKARAGAGCLELGAPVEHPAGAGLESHRNISTKGVSSATGGSAGVPLERLRAFFSVFFVWSWRGCFLHWFALILSSHGFLSSGGLGTKGLAD